MKPVLLSLLCLTCFCATAQRFALVPRISVNTAAGDQIGKFKNAYSLGTGFEMALTKGSPLKLAVDADAGINGSRTVPYEFNFRGTTTKTSINYTSAVYGLGAGLRYVFNQGKTVSPYAGTGLGLLVYSTSYMIEDPHDVDGCRALESNNVQRDAAFTARAEGGVRWLTKWRTGHGDRIAIDAGVTYLRGTQAEFVRLGKVAESSAQATDYTAKFETPTAEVHEHAIGKRYTTEVNQVVYRLGVHIPLTTGTKTKRSCGAKRSCL